MRLWDRPRPFAVHDVRLLLEPSANPSFPSDHATFFAVVIAILLVSRRAGIAALALAVVVSVARVYVGEHYVSDVLAGAGIGGGMACVLHGLQSVVLPLLDPPPRLARRVHLA